MIHDKFDHRIYIGMKHRIHNRVNILVVPLHIVNNSRNEVGIGIHSFFQFNEIPGIHFSHILFNETHNLFCFVMGMIDAFRKQRFFFKANLFFQILFMFDKQFFLHFISLADSDGRYNKYCHQPDEDEYGRNERNFIEA